MSFIDALQSPLAAEAVEGEVLLPSPGCNLVQVAMTPKAVLDSLDAMRQAASEAIAQAAKKRPPKQP